MNEYFKKKERKTIATEILPSEITFRLVSCLLYTQEDKVMSRALSQVL